MSHQILFLCVANSARSQIAEGLARSLVRKGVNVMSAGSNPSSLHPLAAVVLAEKGIATTEHYSKGLGDVSIEAVDTVITLCEEEVCPALPEGARHLHWPMSDPAVEQANPEAAEDAFREVRDEIYGRLRDWLEDNGLSAIA